MHDSSPTVTPDPAPHVHERKRGRWWKVLLAVVVVLGIVLVITDRVAANMAEDKLVPIVEEAARDHDTTAENTSVKLSGFPFLTQVLAGEFRGATVTMKNVKAQDVDLERLNVRLSSVDVPRDVIFGGTAHDVVASTVTGSVRITAGELADLANTTISSAAIKDIKLGADNGDLTGSVHVTYAGFSGTISGEIKPHIENGRVWVSFISATAGNLSIPPAVLDLANGELRYGITIPPLPFGLSVQNIRIDDDTVVLRANARNVELVK